MTPSPEDGSENISRGREAISFFRNRFLTYGHTGYSNALIYHYDQPLRVPGVIRVLKWMGIAPTTGLRVLDVGCGTGDLVLELARSGAHVTATDHVGQMVSAASLRVHEAGWEGSFVEGRVEDLPFKSNSFDLVTSVTVLQHLVDEKDFSSGVAELARVVRDAGHILLLEMAPNRSVTAPLPFEYLKVRNRDSYVRSFEEVGCRIVKEVEWPQVGISVVRGLSKFGWLTLGKLSARGLMLVMRTTLRLTRPLDRALLGFPLVHSDIRFMVFRKGEG